MEKLPRSFAAVMAPENEVLELIEKHAAIFSSPPSTLYAKLSQQGVVSLAAVNSLSVQTLVDVYQLTESDAKKINIVVRKELMYLKNRHCVLSEEETMSLYSTLLPEISNCAKADICFICDITYSMNPYVATLKSVLKGIIADIIMKTHMTPRFAFVGFRDKDDSPPQFIVHDFTENIGDLEELLNKVDCFGGEDPCEDIRGAMLFAQGLAWKNMFKFTVLVIEAPPHGKTYNCGIGDSYPDDDKLQPSLEKVIAMYSRMSHILVFKCNETVKPLATLFRKYGGNSANTYAEEELEVGTGATEIFRSTFAKSVETSYQWGKHVITSTYKDPALEEDIDRLAPGHVMQIKLSVPEVRKEPDFQTQRLQVEFELAPRLPKEFKLLEDKVLKGAFKNAFKAQDVGNSKEMYVIKAQRFRAVYTTVENVKNDLEAYLVAKYCADCWNTTKVGSKHRITFLTCMAGELNDTDASNILFNGNKYVLVERFLPESYVKYNNNAGWKNEELKGENKFKVAQAFSHFSYETTIGTYLIVDLQGCEVDGKLYFTDPSVHSFVFREKFGGTNCGKHGIASFFKTHTCNEFCDELELFPLNMILNSTTETRKEQFTKVAATYMTKKLVELLAKSDEDKGVVEAFDYPEESKKLMPLAKFFRGSAAVETTLPQGSK